MSITTIVAIALCFYTKYASIEMGNAKRQIKNEQAFFVPANHLNIGDMKTLQNDLTTIEQSERLLELGVPKNSANHYYGKDCKLHYIDGTIPYSLLWETGCTPCWSVGRLMKIIKTCTTDKETLHDFFNMLELTSDELDILMHILADEEGILNMDIDFSKLED